VRRCAPCTQCLAPRVACRQAPAPCVIQVSCSRCCCTLLLTFAAVSMRAFRGSHYAIQALSELVYMHNSSRMPSVTRICNLRAQQHWPTHQRVDGLVLGLGTARTPLADGRVEGLPRVALGRLKRVRRKVLAGGGNLRTARRNPRADQCAPRGTGSLAASNKTCVTAEQSALVRCCPAAG